MTPAYGTPEERRFMKLEGDQDGARRARGLILAIRDVLGVYLPRAKYLQVVGALRHARLEAYNAIKAGNCASETFIESWNKQLNAEREVFRLLPATQRAIVVALAESLEQHLGWLRIKAKTQIGSR